MFSLERTVSLEQIVKKSRFVATAIPIAGEGAVREALAAHSDTHASHNCWAWRVGPSYRFNDDGEPGGTAGKPILQAIDGQAFDKVLVIVTRWFGGVLLGTGGLVRAYGGTAAACLRTGNRFELVPRLNGTIRCSFSDLALVKARTGKIDGMCFLGESFFDTGARILISFPEARLDEIAQLITDVTSGRSLLLVEKT